eukprot:TRINITY_DN4078_c0_g1_i1.p1 TRINITY_DN4078_c0_g1~~TRINITY_DN4078_c0_g1_i1.p1  ORF type:complete len:1766 (+),score=425.86 TRINITY_DN4078_c0_g1_i1:48-5300(+)
MAATRARMAAVLLWVRLATAGSVCSNSDCVQEIDGGTFGDALWSRNSGFAGSLVGVIFATRLCNETNWKRALSCLTCPVALELTEPTELGGVRICLKDHGFSPSPAGDSTVALSTDHPLIGRELEVVTPGEANSDGCTEGAALDHLPGTIALVPRGNCYFVVKSANAGRAGALATVIVNNVVEPQTFGGSFQTFTMGGTTPDGGLNVTMMAPHESGMAAIRVLRQNRTVRGILRMDCGSPQVADVEYFPNCPMPGLSCSANRDSHLCDGCELEALVNGQENRTGCLFGNLLLPLRTKNSLLPAASSSGQDFPTKVVSRLCTDKTGKEPLTGYSCADMKLIIDSGQLPGCWALPMVFPSVVADFFSTCLVCTGCIEPGCDAADFANATGHIVAISLIGASSTRCPFSTTASLATEAGAVAVVLMHESDNPPLVEGISAHIDLPVHSMGLPGSALVLDAAQGGASVHLRLRKTDRSAAPSPAPEQAGEAVLEPADGFKFTWPVIVCLAVATILLALNVGTFTRQRARAIRFKKSKGALVSVPLSIASLGVAVSLLVCITTVTFVLVYQTGKQTTDTALDEGWEAVAKTHANAVTNVEGLKTQLLASYSSVIKQGLTGTMLQAVRAGQVAARILLDYQDSWEYFSRITDFVTDVGAATSLLGYALRTVDGKFAAQSTYTVNMSEISPEYAQEHELWVLVKEAAYGEYMYVDPVVFDPTKYFGRQYQSAVELVRHRNGEYLWVPATHVAPIHYQLFLRYVPGVPLSLLYPMYSKQKEFVGAMEVTLDLQILGDLVSSVTLSEATRNLTIVLLEESDGIVIASSVGQRRHQMTIESYGRSYDSSDRLTAPLALANMPLFELNAAYNYVKVQHGGYAAAMKDAKSFEFDQAEWYARTGQQPFQVMKVTFDGGDATDESGNNWKLGLGGSSRVIEGGRDGRCLDVDGLSSMELYTNLTTDIPRVAEARNVSSPAFNPSYNRTKLIGNVEVVMAADQFPFPTRSTRNATIRNTTFVPLQRESVITDTFTITMWVRAQKEYATTKFHDASYPTLLTDTIPAPGGDWGVRFYASGRLMINSAMRKVACDTPAFPERLPVGEWVHVAAQVDRWGMMAPLIQRSASVDEALTVQECRVYVNGELVSAQPIGMAVQLYDLVPSFAEPFRIGHGFTGQIDSVHLYNVSLDASEIQHDMRFGEFRRVAPSRRWYMDLSRYYDNGITWLIMVLLPRQDVMREVDRVNELQKLNQTVRRDNTEKKLSQRTVETLLATLVIAFGSIMVFLLFNEALTRPIGKFARQLLDVSVMRLDAVDEESSILAEVDAMYVAMTLVIGNLREFRQYLPQSLMLMNDDKDEEESDAAPPSDVAETVRRKSKAGTERGNDESMSEGSMHRAGSRITATKSSVFGVDSSVASSGQVPVIVATVHQHLHHKTVSLAVLNVLKYRSLADQNVQLLSSFHDQYIQEVGTSAMQARGLVDVFIGDRVYVSFNAIRTCTAHRSTIAMFIQSVTAESAFAKGMKLQLSSGACTGSAMCGSLGSTGMKRFSIVGNVAGHAPLYERVAAQYGSRCFCDDTIRRETAEHFSYRLAECVTFAKVSQKPLYMFDLRGFLTSATGHVQPGEIDQEEWMYCMDAREDKARSLNPWTRYNDAQRIRWSGADPQRALQRLAEESTGQFAGAAELQFRDELEAQLHRQLTAAAAAMAADAKGYKGLLPRAVTEVGLSLIENDSDHTRVDDRTLQMQAAMVGVERARQNKPKDSTA